jgi:hypothetical protein
LGFCIFSHGNAVEWGSQANFSSDWACLISRKDTNQFNLALQQTGDRRTG